MCRSSSVFLSSKSTEAEIKKYVFQRQKKSLATKRFMTKLADASAQRTLEFEAKFMFY